MFFLYRAQPPKAAVRSSLTGDAPRLPGQSLDDEVDRLYNDDIQSTLLLCAVIAAILAMQWLSALLNLPLHPVACTLIAAPVLMLCGSRLVQMRAKLGRMRLGRDSEREVGALLEELRAHGAQVLHDVRTDKFNVDHVVISPHGILAVETKTWSKRARGRNVIKASGTLLRRNGDVVPDSPIEQAMDNAQWLRNRLHQLTGEWYPVHPVVLFPGWSVDPQTDEDARRAWVLSPKRLFAQLRAQPRHLNVGQVARATEALHTHELLHVAVA